MFTGIFIDAFVVAFYYEMGSSDMNWNIAADPTAAMGPNVLSELTFTDMEHSGPGIHLYQFKELSENYGFIWELDYSSSSVDDGSVRDSDYFGDNRTMEFSRSYADISGDDRDRLSLGMGVKIRWFGSVDHYFSAIAGIQKYQLNLVMTDGLVAIPEEFAGERFHGLRSTYDSDFDTWYLALQTEHVFSFGTFGLRYEYLDIDWEAKADWNLRDDFAHPVSFKHLSEGKGWTLTAGYSYAISRAMDIFLNYTMTDYDIDDGYDHTYFSDGSSYVTRLNELEHESDYFQLGIRFLF